jgi:hypothetical protein
MNHGICDTRKKGYVEMILAEYERTILDFANTAAGRLLILIRLWRINAVEKTRKQ